MKIGDRREIANEYSKRMQDRRELDLQSRPPRRVLIFKELADEYRVTPRMIKRAIEEFLPKIRKDAPIWAYATEGMNEVRPIPARIKKLKPGVYADNKLRLVVGAPDNRNPVGKHTWIFRFIWRSIVRDLVLGGLEISLATARERATKASRMLAAGQNPDRRFSVECCVVEG